MREKGTTIVFTNWEIMVMVHTIVKAAAYEFDLWHYIENKKPEEIDKFVDTMTANIRTYEEMYTQMINKLCREQARHQGGIYRAMTYSLRRDSAGLVRRAAEEAIAGMNEAARSIKRYSQATRKLENPATAGL